MPRKINDLKISRLLPAPFTARLLHTFPPLANDFHSDLNFLTPNFLIFQNTSCSLQVVFPSSVQTLSVPAPIVAGELLRLTEESFVLSVVSTSNHLYVFKLENAEAKLVKEKLLLKGPANAFSEMKTLASGRIIILGRLGVTLLTILPTCIKVKSKPAAELGVENFVLKFQQTFDEIVFLQLWQNEQFKGLLKFEVDANVKMKNLEFLMTDLKDVQVCWVRNEHEIFLGQKVGKSWSLKKCKKVKNILVEEKKTEIKFEEEVVASHSDSEFCFWGTQNVWQVWFDNNWDKKKISLGEIKSNEIDMKNFHACWGEVEKDGSLFLRDEKRFILVEKKEIEEKKVEEKKNEKKDDVKNIMAEFNKLESMFLSSKKTIMDMLNKLS